MADALYGDMRNPGGTIRAYHVGNDASYPPRFYRHSQRSAQPAPRDILVAYRLDLSRHRPGPIRGDYAAVLTGSDERPLFAAFGQILLRDHDRSRSRAICYRGMDDGAR